MTGDKSKMESLKKIRHGNVILGTNVSSKFLGQGKGKINKTRGESHTLLFQGLKKNILSVGQMEDKRNIIVFTSTKCKVMNGLTRKFIARGYRNPNNLYIFKEWNSHIYEKYLLKITHPCKTICTAN